MTESKRWSSEIPEEKMLPKGPLEALARAKEALRPFTDGHLDGEVCKCEQCAESRIRKLARHCNALRYLAKGAPRTGHIIQNLQEVARQSRQLAVTLSSLDDYSRDWLVRSRPSPPGQVDTRLLQARAKTQDLPHPTTIAMGDGALVGQLEALGQYADIVAAQFNAWRQLYSPFPINDIGGSTNMVSQRFGTPTEKLVLGAFHIFEYFKPDAARKTENGSFHRFVNDIHWFATGSEKGQSSLFEFIKQIMGPNGTLKLPNGAVAYERSVDSAGDVPSD
jgi:hypothetical protein